MSDYDKLIEQQRLFRKFNPTMVQGPEAVRKYVLQGTDGDVRVAIPDSSRCLIISLLVGIVVIIITSCLKTC